MSVELVLIRLKRCSPMLKLIKVLIKVNNGNTKIETLNLFEVNCKDTKKNIDVNLVSLVFTMNQFHLFFCFH